MPLLQRKDGTPTAYGFACGYVIERELGNRYRLRVYREHGVYHVNGFIAAQKLGHPSRHVWESSPTANGARRILAKLSAEHRRFACLLAE